MQNLCTKCATETNDDNDLHCRRVLIDQIKKLLMVDRLEDAEALVLREQFDEGWKSEISERLFSEPQSKRRQLMHYKEQINLKLKKLLLEYHFDEAEYFYEQHSDAMEKAEYDEFRYFAVTRQRQQVAILHARAYFVVLADEYQVDINNVVDEHGPTPLAQILIKLNQEEVFDESDTEWLEANKMFKLLATYYHKLSQKFPDDAWHLAKASKYFRRADQFMDAIKITDGFSERSNVNSGPDSAVYTSRGAAFRDLGRLHEAKNCINEAINLSPNSFYPYMVLGGILYDQQDFENGDMYFEKAVSLGASPKAMDIEISGTLKKSDTETRQSVIDYLLRKDQKKYAWVGKFQAQ